MAKCSNPHCKCVNCKCGDNCTCTEDKCNCPPGLNRAIGQLEGIKKMIEEQRYCPDIIVQLKAVRSAIKHVESNILKTHLEECVAKSFSDSEIAKEKIMEIKTLLDKMQG